MMIGSRQVRVLNALRRIVTLRMTGAAIRCMGCGDQIASLEARGMIRRVGRDTWAITDVGKAWHDVARAADKREEAKAEGFPAAAAAWESTRRNLVQRAKDMERNRNRPRARYQGDR